MTHPNPHLAYRPDIDGLRAIAVLSVVIFHAFPALLPGGFIGVDIFFVISGYLISSIIFKAIGRGDFSFADFYARRIRRIFPTLLLVTVTSLLVGWSVLLPDEYGQLGKHSLAGLGFVANFIFWQEAGYFDVAADLKPMLHLWSLGIEEQFYIVWPALAILGWSRGWSLGRLVVLLGISSLLGSIVLTGTQPVSSFFLPFSRAWELFAGAGLAWMTHRGWRLSETNNYWARACAISGLLMIAVGLVLIDKESAFPGAWALLPVAGASLLIAAGPASSINQRVLANPVMIWVGLISFPLYLWHWPLLSFVRIVFTEQAENHVLLLAVVFASVALSWLSYRLIETPVRRRGGPKTVVALILASLILAALSANIFVRDGLAFRLKDAQAKREAMALEWPNTLRTDQACMEKFGGGLLAGWCQVAAQDRTPNAMIIGDSHANHYFWALKDVLLEDGINLMQSASGGCMPVQSADLLKEGRFLGCNKIIDPAIEYALKHQEIKTVFLAGRWGAYIARRELKDWATGVIDDQDIVLIENGLRIPSIDSHQAFQRGLDQTLTVLQQAGKRVIFLHTVPELDFNARLCVTWSPNSLVNRTPRPDCKVARELIVKRDQEFRPVIDDVLKRHPDVDTFNPHDLMCSDELCLGRRDGVLLYRDDDHLSLEGARWLGLRMREPIRAMLQRP